MLTKRLVFWAAYQKGFENCCGFHNAVKRASKPLSAVDHKKELVCGSKWPVAAPEKHILGEEYVQGVVIVSGDRGGFPRRQSGAGGSFNQHSIVL